MIIQGIMMQAYKSACPLAGYSKNNAEAALTAGIQTNCCLNHLRPLKTRVVSMEWRLLRHTSLLQLCWTRDLQLYRRQYNYTATSSQLSRNTHLRPMGHTRSTLDRHAFPRACHSDCHTSARATCHDSVAKFIKLGGKAGLTENIYTTFKN